jgi:outer membrane protein TolC
MKRERQPACLGAAIACVLATPTQIRAQEPLRFAEAAAARLPHEREIDAEAFLADAASAAVGAGSWLLEGPTASGATGGRRPDRGDAALDVGFEIELPLQSDRQRRLELANALDESGASIRAAARAIALADLAGAYAGAWLAQAIIDLRAEDLALTDAWHAATQRRVEAGADPPYESILVAGERDRALVELIAARREVELKWGELARLAALGGEPRVLDLASLPGGAGPASSGDGAGAATLAGIESRRDLALLLARAQTAAASSRWALNGDAAREGEEENIAHVGVSYRFARHGERAALAVVESAAAAAAENVAAAERVDLRARLAAAAVPLAAEPSSLDDDDLRRAREALDSRLDEGRDRASTVLPLRRQLLEAALAAVAARAARAQAAAEIFFLDGGLP